MKKIILIPLCLSFIFCSNQIKMNKGKDVDIIFTSKYISGQEAGKQEEEVIKNNTNNTYIIDPYGFYGKSYVLENGSILEPYTYFKNGYYSRDNSLCHDDLIILKPFETMHHSLNYDRNNRGIYRYSQPNKYEMVIKSFHNKYNALILGCDDYVKELETKGYKVLEDSISVKIPVRH